ncbi:MAG: hypothetical protein WD740_04510 [Anaerolineales bacterium]
MHQFASIALGAAGLIHLFLAPQHYAHAPAHGIFFAVAGLAQIVWAVAFIRKPSMRLYYAGLALAGGLVVLWGLTRVFPAPFHDQAEVVDLGGIVCKLSELAGLGALLALAAQGGILGLGRQTMARLAAIGLLLAAAGGLLSYGIGRAAEPLFPSLFGAEHVDSGLDHADSEHSEDHQHEEGEQHEHSD